MCASTNAWFRLKMFSLNTETSQALSPSQYFLSCLLMNPRNAGECWCVENASLPADRLANSADAEAPPAVRHSPRSAAATWFCIVLEKKYYEKDVPSARRSF